jgi:hypothetical protein
MKTILLATAVTLGLAIVAACTPVSSQPPHDAAAAWAIRAREFHARVPPSPSNPTGQVTYSPSGTISLFGASGGGGR